MPPEDLYNLEEFMKNAHTALENVIGNFKLFKSCNANFHESADIHTHSALTALCIEQWFDKPKTLGFLINEIQMKDGYTIPSLSPYKNVILLAAYLHDIGKIGIAYKRCVKALPLHSLIGYEFFEDRVFVLNKTGGTKINSKTKENVFISAKNNTVSLKVGNRSTTQKNSAPLKALFSKVFNNYTNDSIYGRDKLLCIIAIVIKLHYCFGDTLENKWNFVHDDFLATLKDPPVKICYESEIPLSVGQIIDIYDELPIPTKRYIVTAADKETLYEVNSAPLPEIKPKSESTLPPQYAGSFNYDDIPIFKGTIAGNSKNLYKKTQFDKAGKMWVKYFIYSLKRIQTLYSETFYYDEILNLARIVMLISFADVKGAARTCATYTSTIWPKVVNSNLEFHTYQQINNKPHYTKADGTTAQYVDPWNRFNMESEEKRTLYTNIIQSVYTTVTAEFAVKFIPFDGKQFPFIRTIIPSLESKNISRRIGYTQNILCNLDITHTNTKSRSHTEFLFPGTAATKTMPTFIKDLRNILKTNFKILSIDSAKLKSVFHSTYCEGDCWFTNIKKKAEIPQIKLPFNGMGFAQFATDVRHSYSYLKKFIDAKKIGYVIEKPIDKGIAIPLLFIESRNDIYAILRHASKTLVSELEAYDKTSNLNTPGFSVLSTDFKGPKRFSILNTKYDTPQTTLHMWRQATDEILKQTKPQAPELVRYYMTTILEHMEQYSKRPDAAFVFENVNLYKNLVKELEKTPHKIAGVEINCWFALLKIGGWFSPDVCEISLNRNINFYDDKYFKDTKFLTGGKVVFKLEKTNAGNLKETKLNVTADKIYFDTNKPFDSTNISLLMYDEALKAPINASNFYNYQYVYNLRFSDDFAAKESNIKQLPFDNYTHNPKVYAKYLENKTWTLPTNSPNTNPFPFCSLYTCYKLHGGRAALNPSLFNMPLNLEDGSARAPTYKLTKLLPTCDEYNWVTTLYNNTVTCDGKNPILRPIVPKVLPDGKKYQITGTQLKNYYGAIQSVVRIDNDFVTYYANLFSHTPVGGKARFQPDSDNAYNNHLKNIWSGDLTNINSLLTQPNKSGKFIPVFHGTTDMSIASLICMNGFKISNSGMFGGGVYTAYSPNKPWMYSNPKSTRYIYENPDAPNTEYGYIFLCEAYVGNCIDIDMKRNRDLICKTDKELCSKWSPPTKNKGTVTDKIIAEFWEKRNIDCILGVGSEQNELVFYNSTLILPKYMFVVKMIRFPLSKGISICNKKAKTKRIATVHSKRTTYRISK